MDLTLFMQVLPKAGLGWLGVFAVTIIIVAARWSCWSILQTEKSKVSICANNSETVSIGGDLPTMGVLKGRWEHGAAWCGKSLS